MEKYGVQMEAWAPFGEGRSQMFTNPVLAEIGAKYGKTVAQVILRWHLQRGVVVIPKSTHRERMQESPKYEELCRRFLSDAKDFSGEKLKEAGITRRFVNQDLDETEEEIRRAILEDR